MTIASIAVLCVAGISLYVAFTHFLYYFGLRWQRENLSFAMICLTMVLYDILCAGLYSASCVGEGAMWQTAQMATMTLLGICTLWFANNFIQRKMKWWDYLLIVYWVLLTLVMVFAPRSIFFPETKALIKEIVLFGKHFVTYYEAAQSPLLNVVNLIGLLAAIYIAGLLASSLSVINDKAKARPVIIGMIILVIGITNDTAVSTGLYKFFYLTEYAFLFLALAMAFTLIRNYLASKTALIWSQEKLTNLAAAVNQAEETIMITDAKGIIQYVNPCFEKMTGYTFDEVRGQHIGVIKSGQQDEEFYGNLWKTISSGQTWRGIFVNKKKDGTLFEESAVISPIRDNDGKIVNYVAVKRDVTHEHILENQVRQSQKMAAIGQLSHKIAHDFTNVLVTITGNVSILKMKLQDKPEICARLDDVLAGANNITLLTSELLSFSHPSKPVLKIVRLDRVVRGTTEILKETVRHEDIELEMDVKPAGKVEIDPSRIEQVIVHIAINAIEAMSKGGKLTIKTGPAELSKAALRRIQADVHATAHHNGDFAFLSISDTGTGMDQNVCARIFEPFFTTKDDQKNSGLGLTTSYTIIKQHKGTITVDSEPDRGTTFTVYLPIVE